MKLRGHAAKWYRQLISLRGEPHNIAYGLAIGVFIGVTPTIPFHTLLIVFLCFLLRKNITAAYLGSWLVSNPVTIPFFYLSQYRLGKFLLGDGCSRDLGGYSLVNLLQKSGDAIWPLLLGGLVMAPFFAIPAWILARKLIITARKKDHDDG